MTPKKLTDLLQHKFGDKIQIPSMRTLGGSIYYVYCYYRDSDHMFELNEYLSEILPSKAYRKKTPAEIKKLSLDARGRRENQPTIFCSVTSRILSSI